MFSPHRSITIMKDVTHVSKGSYSFLLMARKNNAQLCGSNCITAVSSKWPCQNLHT